jgi:hypothetical protein
VEMELVEVEPAEKDHVDTHKHQHCRLHDRQLDQGSNAGRTFEGCSMRHLLPSRAPMGLEMEAVEMEPVEVDPVEMEPVETEPVETEPVEMVGLWSSRLERHHTAARRGTCHQSASKAEGRHSGRTASQRWRTVYRGRRSTCTRRLQSTCCGGWVPCGGY